MSRIAKLQIVTTDKGEEMVLLARTDYEALVARASAVTDEDLGTARIVARSNVALAAGRDMELPAEVAEAIARGENPLRVIRRWRDMTQLYLGEIKTDIGQSMISALEKGTRRGTPAMWKRLSRALDVPIDVLIPD